MRKLYLVDLKRDSLEKTLYLLEEINKESNNKFIEQIDRKEYENLVLEITVRLENDKSFHFTDIDCTSNYENYCKMISGCKEEKMISFTGNSCYKCMPFGSNSSEVQNMYLGNPNGINVNSLGDRIVVFIPNRVKEKEKKQEKIR